jgi:tetratricopeptide (TPR) repeat protein
VLGCLGLMGLLVAGYWPIRFNGIVFCDDPLYIRDNPHVAAGLTADGFLWAFRTMWAANWHPLTWLSLMLDVQLWGVSVPAHHFTNVFYHALSSILLFLLLARMTGERWKSAFVAGIFAVHPLHVESVAWAAERKDVLCALFFIITLWWYVEYVKRPRWWRYAAAVVCFALALLSKPMAVTLPFVLLLLDYWPLKRLEIPDQGSGKAKKSSKTKRPLVRLLIEKIPFFVLSALSCGVTFIAQRLGGAVVATEHFSLSARIGNTAVSYLKYIGAAIVPSRLAFFYPHEQWPGWLIGASLVVVALVTAVTLMQRKRRPYLAIGWFWFLGMLVPVIGIVQVGMQSRADRYMYLPIVGLSIMVAWGLAELAERWRLQKALGALAVCVLVACAAGTQRQVRYWRETVALCEHALEVTGDNDFVCTILGIGHANAKEYQKALDAFQRAINSRPNDVLALTLTDMGNVYVRMGEWDHARECFEEVQRKRPLDAGNLGSFGDYYFARNQLAEAARAYEETLRLEPDQGQVQTNLALVYIRQHRFDRAIELLERMEKVSPKNPEVQFQLGLAFSQQGKLEHAEEHLRRSLALHPAAPQVHYELARIKLRQKNLDQAKQELREAVRLDSNYVAASQDLAWILATDPDAAKRDPRQAVDLAQRANELSGQGNADILDTLAAAYATSGDFAKALDAGGKAIDLAKRAGKPELVQQIEARLALYRAGKSFTDVSLVRGQ